MGKTFITLMDLAGPYTLSNKTSKDGWSKWAFLYKSCYEKDTRFPSLQASLSELFSLKDFEAMQQWARLTMKYIKSSKFRYTIAFAGEPKLKTIQKMMKKFEIKIKELEPSLIDFADKIFFLSLEKGEIKSLKPAKDYLD